MLYITKCCSNLTRPHRAIFKYHLWVHRLGWKMSRIRWSLGISLLDRDWINKWLYHDQTIKLRYCCRRKCSWGRNCSWRWWKYSWRRLKCSWRRSCIRRRTSCRRGRTYCRRRTCCWGRWHWCNLWCLGTRCNIHRRYDCFS